jgi:mRNA-degrading endonuclease HigB of HigAB toxin-antitoxin module
MLIYLKIPEKTAHVNCLLGAQGQSSGDDFLIYGIGGQTTRAVSRITFEQAQIQSMPDVTA